VGDAPARAWVLNLDAELELARPGYVRSPEVSAHLRTYAAQAMALLGPDDVCVGSRDVDGWPGRAWCPTPLALEALCRAGAVPEPHPELSVLKAVNHRRFGFELGGGPPGATYVTTVGAVEDLLASQPRDWLCKRAFGFAGRGQLRLRHRIEAHQRVFIERSIAGDGLLLEPLVAPTLELALHGFLWPDGRTKLGRPCVQRVGPRGTWLGSRLVRAGELTPSEDEALHASAERVAAALVARGYFGPFNVDAYRYQLQGASGFCALGEINARYSMGFPIGFGRSTSELEL